MISKLNDGSLDQVPGERDNKLMAGGWLVICVVMGPYKWPKINGYPRGPQKPMEKCVFFLTLNIWVITPKNEGYGFAWYPALFSPYLVGRRNFPCNAPIPSAVVVLARGF